jgi:hypothetical protein
MTDETWGASVRAGADASLWSFPGADASLWSLPGADPPRSPLPDADAPRSPLPGADPPRSPLPGADAPRSPLPDADAPRSPLPGADPPRSPLPGADAPRSPLPDADAPRSPMPGADPPRSRSCFPERGEEPPVWRCVDCAFPGEVRPYFHFVEGENGHPALTAEALDNSLLALFDKIVRGLKAEILSALIDRVLEDARASSDVEMVKNLFVMAFQTRWCRGGKAERLLFYQVIIHLYRSFPEVVLALMHFIPRYGYWKDLLSLLLQCPQPTARDDGDDYSGMRARVWSLFADQLGSDLLELETALEEGRTPQISLCAKYAPSEGGQHSKTLHADKEICKILFRGAADSSCHGAKYRRMLSLLRKQLLLTETNMCAQRWNAIDFSKVPSLCMDRHKHAFLNEKIAGGFKHPADPERMACRERLLEHLVSGAKLNGQQLFPHELARQVCRADGCRRACEIIAYES